MSKKIISILLTAFFLAVITLPRILVVIEDTIDLTELMTDVEEEETTSIHELDVEALFSSLDDTAITFLSVIDINSLSYCYKQYDAPCFNIISPPPDLLYLLSFHLSPC